MVKVSLFGALFFVASCVLVEAFEVMGNVQTIEPGRRVWITGASSGLGEALAYEIAKDWQESRLVISARTEEKLKEVAKRCVELGAAECRVLPMDQSKIESLPTRQALNCFQGLDAVFINGGISSRGKATDTDAETLAAITNVNFLSSAEIGRAAARDMIERNIKGRIVVVSSVQAYFGLPLRSAYGATKHAVKGYFDSLRAEVADAGITVTVASPGYISTNLSKNAVLADGTAYGATDKTTANGADPKDVARTIITAAKDRKAEIFVYPGLSARFAIFLRAFWPSLLFSIMASRARKNDKKLN